MNLINHDDTAYILTIVILVATYYTLKKSKYYNNNSLGYMFMYVSAPIFLMCKWIMDLTGDYNSYAKYIILALFGIIILYILFTAKKKSEDKYIKDD